MQSIPLRDIAFGALGGIAGACLGYFLFQLIASQGGTTSSRHLNLPTKENIDSVTVSLVSGFLNEPDTEEFKLPSSHVETLLDCLSANPILCYNTAGFGEPIILLKIVTRNGTTKIGIPWSGKNKLYFTVEGVACERDGEYLLQNPITKAEIGFAPDELMLLYRFLKDCRDNSESGH